MIPDYYEYERYFEKEADQNSARFFDSFEFSGYMPPPSEQEANDSES